MSGSNFHKPPPPEEEFDPEKVLGLVKEEAKRQLEKFHPKMGPVHEERRLLMIQEGIMQMMRRGAARVQEEGIVFWNPREGHFQQYDEDYNTTMLNMMQEFKAQYTKTQTDKYDD